MSTIFETTTREHHRKIRNRFGWTIVRFFVAVLLLVASVLKAYQSPVWGNSLFETRWFQILLVEGELALAVILLFGIVPKISWRITTTLFVIFSVVSLLKGLSGAESCQCFGSVNINPFLTFTLDIGILVLLILFRPQNFASEPNENPKKSNWFLQTFSMTAVLIVVSVVQVYLFFGSFEGTNQFLSTNEITFAIDETSEPQNKNIVGIFVINHTSRPFTLIGAKTDCSCGAVEGIPLTINAHEKASVSFVISDKIDKLSRSKKEQKIVFFVEDSGTKRISAMLPIFKYLVRNEKSL
jgi:hypothetical protein